MDTDRIRATVLESLADVAPNADLTRLVPAVSFHDQYEIDSVDFMNLMLALERSFSVRIPEADYPKLSSLNGCVRYLEPKLAEKPERERVRAQ